MVVCVCVDCGEKREHQARGLCKPCYDRRWYIKRRDQVLARMRRWREMNPDYNRNWYKNNSEYYCQYRKNNREKVNAHSRYWKQNNSEKVAATRRRYREANREKVLARIRRWQEANPDYHRQYRQQNPDKVVAANARRRSLKKVVPDTLTSEQIAQLLNIGKTIYPGQKLHLDHIVPLSKGGGTTRANLHYIPALLNCSKNDKLPQEVYSQLTLDFGGRR